MRKLSYEASAALKQIMSSPHIEEAFSAVEQDLKNQMMDASDLENWTFIKAQHRVLGSVRGKLNELANQSIEDNRGRLTRA